MKELSARDHCVTDAEPDRGRYKTTGLRLAAITRYPVKSCGGTSETQIAVDACGLAGDRRWMVVDEAFNQVTARERPTLLRVRVQLSEDGMVLSHPEAGRVSVVTPSGGSTIPVTIFGSTVQAAAAGGAADSWFSEVVGAAVRLVYLADVRQRPTPPAFTRSSDRVSFADAFPLLAATTESLAALNELIARGDRPGEGPVPMQRFRPNLVIEGGEAWQEDGWRTVRVGEATFRAVKGCGRCVMTLSDPDTGRRGREPLRTLARHRRFDGLSWFGMNLVPDTPGATVRVGDSVEILDADPSPDGPPR